MLDSINKYVFSPFIRNKGNVIAICASAWLCSVIHRKIIKPHHTKYSIKKRKFKSIDRLKILKLITFGNAKQPCTCEIVNECQNLECFHGALNQILNAINNAQTTMDIAIYIFTHVKICDAVKAAHKRGVTVRIISDCDMSFSESSKIPELRRIGILNRSKMSQFIMHHKYIIIDKQLVIMGSLNFTHNATYKNFETVVMLSNPKFVLGYIENFQLLWDYMRKGHVMPD